LANDCTVPASPLLAAPDGGRHHVGLLAEGPAPHRLCAGRQHTWTC